MNPITVDLRQFIVDNFLFGVEDKRLSANTSFIESGVIDSTGVLELVSFLERRFGIQLADEEIIPVNLDSLNQLTEFVERKQAALCLEAVS